MAQANGECLKCGDSAGFVHVTEFNCVAPPFLSMPLPRLPHYLVQRLLLLIFDGIRYYSQVRKTTRGDEQQDLSIIRQ